MSQQPEDSTASARSTERVADVSVRRAPRYYRFMLVGLIVGVIVALVLTLSFPEQPDFSQLQVFGFIGLFLAAIFVALGALLAIVLDRVSRRRARTVAAELEEHEPEPEALAPTTAAAGPDAVEFVQVQDEPKPEPDPR
ncbi:hypothetical protein ACEXQB_013350 [Herbiconiux sp. P18]|uniref:hypothetical protein n=1 Tax=Herbiconiux liangxiaofengii TaxID=3342795 RepID=UPI0035BB1011